MPPARPRFFHWFFGTWSVVLGYGLVAEWLPSPAVAPALILFFWGVLIASAIGCGSLLPRIIRLWSRPILFRPADGAAPIKLAASFPAPGAVVVAAGCVAGLVATAGTLPFSRTSQLLAGWRGRAIELPRSAPAPEDYRPADIYLLPLRGFPQGAAAQLAADLRRETGLLIAALPAYDIPEIEIDPHRKQVVIESLHKGLIARGTSLVLPPPPRPHSPLVIALMQEDAFSRILDWNFVLSRGFDKVFAAVSTYRLALDLPLDDDAARKRLSERTKKIILRLIAFHALERPQDNDPRSITRTTLRGLPDLDNVDYNPGILFPGRPPIPASR